MRISVFCSERVDLCVAILCVPEDCRDRCAFELSAIIKDACVSWCRLGVASVMKVVDFRSLAS